MFFRRKRTKPPKQVFEERIQRLIRDSRDRPAGHQSSETDADDEPDVMTLLVELRAAGKRGGESPAAHKLGKEFTRYLTEFYNLPAERQPPMLEALLQSARQEREGDLAGAVQTCETGLRICPAFPPIYERLAGLETRRGNRADAERWYASLLVELERQDLDARALEICHRVVESGMVDPELLEQCARHLEAGGDNNLATHCWLMRARAALADDRISDALAELDRALSLSPEEARLHLELAFVYDRLKEPEAAAAAFDSAENFAHDDPETLAQVLIFRAHTDRPSEVSLGRLMDFLDVRPELRPGILERCARVVSESPFNPHLRYLQGVLQAQGGELAEGTASLKVAADRYAAQADRSAELDARLALQQVAPTDEENRRRVAQLHFEQGEVRLAMRALAGLARVARGTT